ncbi:MAG: glucose-1-phosphate thymidylyltransferase RfbA [Deltaproteobacteria bacterium]|nr:glucose-1-phosphate thymidylyltransferase RfbA [Deltaproteobacteria bacterium]
MIRKGIILAGGSGTRLYPITLGVSKQLLPVYNKPMIYYPLSVLMLGGLRHFLIITTPHEQALFQRLLGDGSRWGITLEWAVQPRPAGIAQAFLLGEDFLAGEGTALILGDNIFYAEGLSATVRQATELQQGASIFAYPVDRPEDYGVVEFDAENRVLSLEEKPAQPRSRFAVTGLYFYDPDVVRLTRTLQPSARGELEITDLNRLYLQAGRLQVVKLGRGYAWLDTGSHRTLLQASQFVETIEQRQGLMIACPEETAFRQGWISRAELEKLAEPLSSTDYGRYLARIARE